MVNEPFQLHRHSYFSEIVPSTVDILEEFTAAYPYSWQVIVISLSSDDSAARLMTFAT